MKKRILFLDLDGTVREPTSGAKFINDPHDQKLIEGVEQAIAYYKGWHIIGIANQGGVAAGHKTLEDAKLEQHKTLELLPELQAIYFCPDYEGEICWMISRACEEIQYKRSEYPVFDKPKKLLYPSFRKPGGGMIMLAMDHFGSYPDECLMVGDRPEDKEASSDAEVKFMWAHDWRLEYLGNL